MPFVPLAAMLALIKKFNDWIKQITNRDVNGVITQVLVWVVGVLGVWLAAQTDFASGISIGDKTLDTLNFGSIVFVGLFIASSASLFHDYLQAKDDSNSNTVTKLQLMPSAPDAHLRTRRRVIKGEGGYSVLFVLLVVFALLLFGLGFVVKWAFILCVVVGVVAAVEFVLRRSEP